MQCAACRRDAVVFQPYSGKYLCPVHFTKDFEAKAKRAIRKNRWLLPGDHTAVVLTGDAAEAALLVFLHKLTRDRRDVRLSAIGIDEGTAGGAGYARQAAERCGIGIFAGSFAERYGTTRERIVRDEGAVAAGRTCRVLAGDLAAEIAAANGITRIAVATTVDDPATRFFSDLLNGTVERSLFAAETVGLLKIPVIQPFMDIPKTEVYRYAELAGAGTGDAGSLQQGESPMRRLFSQPTTTATPQQDSRSPTWQRLLRGLPEPARHLVRPARYAAVSGKGTPAWPVQSGRNTPGAPEDDGQAKHTLADRPHLFTDAGAPVFHRVFVHYCDLYHRIPCGLPAP